MALKLPGLKIFSGIDAKSRIFLLFAGVVGISLLIYMLVRFFGGGTAVTGPTNVATAPSGLQSVPGSELTPQYAKLVEQENLRRSERALSEKKTFAVPTLMNAPTGGGENCTVLCPSDENANVADDLTNLVNQSLLAAEEANRLLDLAEKNVSIDEYATALDALVKTGKLTPEQARLLLEKYRKQHANALIKDSAAMMDDMIQAGQLPLTTANELLELQKRNLIPEEYAAELARLTREGKLSRDAAAKLLAQYTQQKSREAAKVGVSALRQMAAAGQITPDVLKTLEDLQSKNIPLDQYSTELNKLVADGKMTPATAAKVLDLYRAQRLGPSVSAAQNAAVERDKALAAIRQMATAKQITPDTAQTLEALLDQNLSPEQYAAALNKLLAEGKLNPEQLAQLLDQYKKLRAALDASPTGALLAKRDQAIASIRQMAASGQITPETARTLEALLNQNLTPEQYAVALNKLSAEGKLTPEQLTPLLQQYKDLKAALDAAGPIGALLAKGGVPGDFAKNLLNKQANNVSLNDYANELKRGVAMKILTPDEAKRLYDQYQATQARVPVAVGGGIAPTVEGNVPFIELQKRIQERAPTAGPPVLPEQFENVPPPPVQGETVQERQQRIQQLLTAMSGQAQSLIAAWQPAVMVHKEGAPISKGTKPGEITEEMTATSSTTTTTSGGPKKPAFIKAGTIIFGVLDTAVDSDYPDTPVMVTIIEGKYKGAKLLGKLSLAQGGDKVSLNFNLMDMDEWPSAKTVSAFAVDPDTARTVMASEVDHHYLERYGAIMATSFLQGYSTAITNAGTSTTGIFGTSTTHPALDASNKIAVGLGQIGTNLNSVAAEKINMPATVKVNSGVGLGILFTAEVTE